MLRLTRVLAAVCVALVFRGCAAHLPAHQWVDAPTALNELRARAAAIRTMSATCTLTLGRSDGYLTTLDGALAAQAPDHLRIRAWKFGNPAFDLTITPDGTWLWRADAADAPQAPDAPGAVHERLARAWALFSGEFFEPPARIIDSGGPRFTVERPVGDVALAVCEVDRRTLTVQTCRIFESAGRERARIDLDRYRLIGDTPWPMRIAIRGLAGPDDVRERLPGLARLVIAFNQVEINADVPPAAFTPPRRAVKQP